MVCFSKIRKLRNRWSFICSCLTSLILVFITSGCIGPEISLYLPEVALKHPSRNVKIADRIGISLPDDLRNTYDRKFISHIYNGTGSKVKSETDLRQWVQDSIYLNLKNTGLDVTKSGKDKTPFLISASILSLKANVRFPATVVGQITLKIKIEENSKILYENTFSSDCSKANVVGVNVEFINVLTMAMDEILSEMIPEICSELQKHKNKTLSTTIAIKKNDRIENNKDQSLSNNNQYSRKYAFVAGISKYKNKKLNTLPYADDDANDFANELKKTGWSTGRMKVLTNKNATKANVQEALDGWLTKAGKNDVIVLFWSGHGFPDPDDPEKVYLACYDTDPRKPWTGYRMDRVVTALKEKGAKNVIVIADTCHAGKLITRGDKGLAVRPYMDNLKNKKQVPNGWIFMVSADADRKAVESSSWSNGAFTYCLLKGLRGEADGFEGIGKKDGIVTMRELRVYLASKMPDETQKVLGIAKHPLITTSSGDPGIWNLSLCNNKNK